LDEEIQVCAGCTNFSSRHRCDFFFHRMRLGRGSPSQAPRL
jgi:hypothetical protein